MKINTNITQLLGSWTKTVGMDTDDVTAGYPQFDDTLAIRSTFAAVDKLVMTTFGFRSYCAKEAALRGENTFSLPQNMGGCRVNTVWEMPVPLAQDLSFEAHFYVHHDGREEAITNALQSRERERDIVISYQGVALPPPPLPPLTTTLSLSLSLSLSLCLARSLRHRHLVSRGRSHSLCLNLYPSLNSKPKF